MFYEYLGKKLNYNYKIADKEDVIIFLHGFGGNIDSFLYHQAYFYSLGYSTLSIDFFGHGDSDDADGDFSIYDFSLALKELIAFLDIKKAIIVSQSFGARVGVLLAGQEKLESVRKLVIISGAGVKLKRSLCTHMKIWTYKIKKKLVKLKILNREKIKNQGSSDYKNLSPSMKKVFIKVIEEDLKKYLQNINIGTLLLWGNKDKDTPMKAAKIFHEEIKKSKLKIFDGRGHELFISEKEKVCKEIERFIIK